MNEPLERENNFSWNGCIFHILLVSVQSTCEYLRRSDVSVKESGKRGNRSQEFVEFCCNSVFPLGFSRVYLFTVNTNLF